MNGDVDTNNNIKPLISNGAKNHQRRRRASSQPSAAPTRPCQTQSFSRDIGHAAAETYLVTSLSFTLLRYLGYFLFCVFLLRIQIFCLVAKKVEPEKGSES
jgi:hypothetical protein